MSTSIDYEKVLNPAQLEAVTTLEGPVLVIAGAGSGKTRTLVYRVARLVEHGVAPESILLLTFTRKASTEMLERAAALSDARCRFVSGGTFHSLAHRVLRSNADRLGYSNSFSILDRADMEEIIQSLTHQLPAAREGVRLPKRGTLASILSKAANLQKPVGDLMAEEYGQFIELHGQIHTLGTLYAEYKKAHQLMDYDDLILSLRTLLIEHEEVRASLGRTYRYVMVDEYQDTNGIQADIARWLAHEHRNIMVVGDDSQAIYSFRGADYRNMFTFPEQFPGAKIVTLEENYRSVRPILEFTNALMAGAAEKYTKCLFTSRSEGVRPRVVDTRTEPDQAGFVCGCIDEEVRRGTPVREIAVLFRAGYHSFVLETELTRRRIAYVKYGGFKFLESAHIKDFLAHLRVVVNRDDVVSWVRTLRLVRNVGQARTQGIIRWMKSEGMEPGQVGRWPGAGKNDKGIKGLGALLGRLTKKGSPREAVEAVMAYYTPILQAKFDDFPKRQKELDQLLPMADRYRSVRSFLDDLVLEPPNGGQDMEPEKTRDVLTLSTIHSAKGLEWSVVFIIWAANGRFPPFHALGDPAAMEEERRLMYVAATRAKDVLILCYPGQEPAPSWSSFGGAHRGGAGMSTLVQGLPEEMVSYESARGSGGFAGPAGYKGGTVFPPRRPAKAAPGGHGLSGTSPGEAGEGSPGLVPGERVRHPAFGPGVVAKLVGGDKVEVFFKHVGRKLLHLDYTALEKM